ncbi:MAG: indolepyruvate oxidoreductase subunit beta [Planctomycetes bacterium]|nr:indolepyruvate oxidoreductase subunit beta [Planctomycetota bacterium]
MEHNLILAGVGGQGILTIARAISIAALRRGMHLKQAEVHGMAQRGGAVQSHLRIADQPIHSDLIPVGQADLILAVEPLEALRYVQYLKEGGAIVASSNAYVNIENYPPIEPLLDRIARFPRHALVHADRLARAAGAARTANAVMLGAVSPFLAFDPLELEAALAEMFEQKGEAVLTANRRAFRFGRNAVSAYLDALRRGGSPREARHWIDSLSPEHLAAEGDLDATGFEGAYVGAGLSAAELHAVARVLDAVDEQGRTRLFEHEVYQLVEVVGAISPPRHIFVPRGDVLSEQDHARFPGEQIVLKIVSPDVVHKTDANGIVFLKNELTDVNRAIERLVERHDATAQVDGVLVAEFVERTQPGFGNELFAGIRTTREFGPVIAAGLGGIDTEYLASKMLPGLAVAKAAAQEVDAEEFFALFQKTAAYDILAGRARGRRRMVPDGELLRCFDAFIAIARHFCVDRGPEQAALVELEVNPFAFRRQHMVPLDGRGLLGQAARAARSRPLDKVRALLEPKSVAVLGVSKSAMNFGRIILNNVKKCDPARPLWVIKEGEERIDGVPCCPSVGAAPRDIDLLVIAAAGEQLPAIAEEVVSSGRVRSAILIPGGVGEKEGTGDLMARVRDAIQGGRGREDGGPVFIGPNSMGVQSRPGGYDTFFIPQAKLDSRWGAPAKRVALISQSGAFLVSRLSNLERLDPAFAISIGNQIDVTVSDLVAVVGARDDVDVLGVYVEGFNDLDGLAFLSAVKQVAASGRIVVFYKAGRTEEGRSAAAGHTASVAGDYDVCLAAVANAGALVVETFKEFEQLIELATAMHNKEVGGLRVGAVSNAGFEAVAMADRIIDSRYRLEMAPLSPASETRLREVLVRHKLDRLVDPRNPLDLTPMAQDAAFEDAVQVMIDSPEVDAVVVSVVPVTPALLTIEAELSRPESIALRLPRLFQAAEKPVITVIDSGSLYDAMASRIREAGVPVFRTCDQAIRSLGRYLWHRSPPRPEAPARALRAERPEQ